MAPKDIRKKLFAEPFQPFRVFISDGATYDVKSRADAYVALTEFVIGIEHDQNDVPMRSVYIAPNHVTRIEPLSMPTRESGASGRRG